MQMINCPSCGARAESIANFCGRCRKPLFPTANNQTGANLSTLGLVALFCGIVAVSAALVLGFFHFKGRQERNDTLIKDQAETTRLLKASSNRNGVPPEATVEPGAGKPEIGPYGIPRDVIGPTGDEANAISALKAIQRAEAAYFAETATSFGSFDELVAHRYLTPVFRGQHPVISGYLFALSVQGTIDPKRPVLSFEVSADPVSGGGHRHFYLDEKGSIHYNLSGPATDKDPFEQYQ